LAISALFAILLVSGLAVVQRFQQGPCDSILVASSNEKSALMTALAADFSAAHPNPSGCGPAVAVERVASGDAESHLDSGWTGSTRPDVWAPQASTWVVLLRARLGAAGRTQLIPDGPLPSLANSPLVVAMPRPMAVALGWPAKEPTWSDLLNLAQNPRGWAERGHPEWGAFRLGKTDPMTSTSGIHALIAAYYVATGKFSDLTPADVGGAKARSYVARVEAAVSHYADTADTFLHNLSAADDGGQALAYVSGVTVEEQELWAYNQGDYNEAHVAPRVPLAAIYPQDGTLTADHPYVTLSWAGTAQRQNAATFLQWLLAPAQQARFAAAGFRDSGGNAAGALGSDPGIVPAEPTRTFRLPQPSVLSAIQSSWSELRKPVRLLVLLDVSSLSALASTAAAIQDLSSDDSVEVWEVENATSAATYRQLRAPTNVGTGKGEIQNAIRGATATAGPHSVFAATLAAYRDVLSAPDPARINAVVLISDGKDDASGPALPDLERQLRPVPSGILVRVYAVAFEGSDQSALEAIARASGGYFSNGVPEVAVRAALDNT
jgi:Ca-activated chloride channel homolog